MLKSYNNMNNKLFEKLRKKIKNQIKEGGSHEFGHVERVLENAIKLAKEEGDVDMEVIKFAALLHDIKRDAEDVGEISCHAKAGAKEASRILENEDFPKDKIPLVAYAIENHRLSKGVKPKTKEAAIIQDADRLDSLGAILVARSFSSAHVYGYPFYDIDGGDCVIKFIRERSAKLKPSNFITKAAKKRAKKRHKYSDKFIETFLEEIKGE